MQGQLRRLSSCSYRRMSVRPDDDLLTVLRGNLSRIEVPSDEKLIPAAIELKRLLLQRTATIEAAIARLNELIREDAPNNPEGK